MGTGHGTRATYRGGCRCLPCRASEAAYRAQLRATMARGAVSPRSLVDARETWQRIQALRRLGVTSHALSRQLGLRHGVMVIGRVRVTRETAQRVEAIWREWMAQ